MTSRELLNVKISLRRRGWISDEIDDFLVFVKNNKPTVEEAEKSKQNQGKNE
ncbi:MAG: hypothetical protein IJ075_06300 [Lachnospiraceae bacterium]|nr:hypothetical protein [Lachnospiraceae bacterium]MBQ9606732.1 hypothetical protein [Lachnospiraceae bacterium]MBR1523315.1 hypothetical protein [Lachnospiraceae bacterium]